MEKKIEKFYFGTYLCYISELTLMSGVTGCPKTDILK